MDTHVMTIEFWFLIGAALVFWMQAGFAMVETGFTRAKNAGNIIMKNLMDFGIGTVVFSLLGYTIMMGDNAFYGLIGIPNFDLFRDYKLFIASPDNGGFTHASLFVFNLVFCATTATIVSGAMSERTKFSAYCIYSAVISSIIYPIEAHWIWGGGWLSKIGFHDFAGSCAIHFVGGIAALIGAMFLGPRIGKYVYDSKGKIVKVNAIPGHSLTLGALGVFILWFGWYGFNGAAATSPSMLASIFLTTTISPAVAACTTMIFTWVRNGNPDVSMCLNAALAGLVGVTAGCDALDSIGAVVVGIVSGILVVLVVEFLDLKLHIDDPVGAVGVHLANGVWGVIAVGLLANPEAPAGLKGLFYTGDAHLLLTQIIGIVAVAIYTTIMMSITFFIIKKTHGLRVSTEEELAGLDRSEHGLSSAYAGFELTVDSFINGSNDTTNNVDKNDIEILDTTLDTPNTSNSYNKFTKIDIICKEEKLYALKEAMSRLGITGMTVSHVMGYGQQKGRHEYYRGVEVEVHLIPKVKVSIVVSKVPVRTVIETAKKILYTGHIGDGKIFIYDVENIVKIRTGEEGYDALQDIE